MTAPVISGTANSTDEHRSGTSLTVNLPSGMQAGETLIIGLSADNSTDPQAIWPTGYHELAQFVADISQLARIVTQHDLTLAPAGQSGDSLRMSLLARTYSYIEAVEGEEPAP